MYQALYRSFRPETFESILGQEHIVKILKNQIAEGTVGHAYLFCGTRGTGKTTMARILAKGVNCTASAGDKPCGVCSLCQAIKDGICMDVIEIDAASNNGVDNIRELRESVNYPPVMGRRKVYIIDEVHMLTLPAFNALLKTLEEPPGDILFILATTEPHKLPATILSRCLKLDFRRVPEKQLKEGLQSICKKLGVNVEDSALALIAANADGSVRDGLSLLDQCIAAGAKEVTREDVLELLGTGGEEVFLALTDLVENRDLSEIILLIDRILADGKDVRRILKDWISHYRNLMIVKFVEKPEGLLSMSSENVERIREQSQKIDLSSISSAILALSETLSEAKWSTQPRIHLELCAIQMAGGGSPGMPAASPSQPDLKFGGKGEMPAGQGRKKEILSGQVGKKEPAAERDRGKKDPAEQGIKKEILPEASGNQDKGAAAEAGQGEKNEMPPWQTKAAGQGGYESPSGKAGGKEELGGQGLPEAAKKAADQGAAAEAPGKGDPYAAPKDVDEIWGKVLLELQEDQGCYIILKNGSRLDRIDGSCFYVEAKNEIVKRYLEDNGLLIKSAMEKQTGRKLLMEYAAESRKTQEEERAGIDRGTVRKMEDFFGTSIEIK